jgi:mono/diheme cytochrome c family protein
LVAAGESAASSEAESRSTPGKNRNAHPRMRQDGHLPGTALTFSGVLLDPEAPVGEANVRLAARFCVAIVFLSCACDRPPQADSLREWTPSDHHSGDDDKLAARDRAAAKPAGPGAAQPSGTSPNDVERLVDVAWRQQCTTCHGASGHGDGQMAAMLHPPDLTSSEWQSRVSDSEMLATIRNGKNRMPRFDLPEPVLQGLVARVRSIRGR